MVLPLLAQQYVQRAAQQYRTAQVATAEPGRLVLMMYDGALRFASQARQAIEDNNIEAANTYLGRVQDIVSELSAALDGNAGEIAANLEQMYEFVNRRLVEANIQKDTDPLDEAVGLLEELRDTWRQVVGGDGGVARESTTGP